MGDPVGRSDEDALLSFERTEKPGLRVVDNVERRQCTIRTHDPVSPTEAGIDGFYFPVDRGIEITASRLRLPHTMAVYVRNGDGWMIAELSNGDARGFPVDRYHIELGGSIKLYIQAESTLWVTVESDGVELEFDSPTDVLVGARSHHKHPAATITTTTDPEDVMTAVSHFGSALKTTSCERSYPTLRGHPPEIELGDELDVPWLLDPPDTGVTIEAPRDHGSVFVVSSLAYYLGAEVVPGDEPRIVTETGFEHRLDDPKRGFEGEVERVLKQVFFLDCVTRTEGYYQVNLHERDAIEDEVDLDFESLYHAPLVDQLEAYLDVDYGLLEPHVPQWKLTAHVTPEPSNVETIPFVVNDLAAIRTPNPSEVAPGETRMAVLDEFMRGDALTRSTSSRSNGPAEPPQLVQLEEADSLEQTWIGDQVPLGASKAVVDAFKNRLDREPADGDIDITVVCNDERMGSESDVVDQIYGSREDLPFDVEVHHGLTTAELADVLRQSVEFLHYIGHIDEEGFECADGTFDAADIEETGVDAFLLNACTSYRQGMHLIEAGSVAGVVTLQEVVDSGAERIGETFARLLNQGFPVRAALNIARTQSVMGGHYLVIGDGNIDVAQSDGGVPVLRSIEKIQDELYEIGVRSYPTNDKNIGSIVIPLIRSNEEYFLNSGLLNTFKLSKQNMIDFLKKEQTAVLLEGKLAWSKEIDYSKL